MSDNVIQFTIMGIDKFSSVFRGATLSVTALGAAVGGTMAIFAKEIVQTGTRYHTRHATVQSLACKSMNFLLYSGY